MIFFFFFKLNVITKHCGLIIKIKTHITCPGPSGAKLTLQTADVHPGPSEADRGLSFINKPYVVMQQQQQVNVDPESYPVAQRLPRIGADLRAWLGIKCGLVPPGPRSTLPPTSNAHFLSPPAKKDHNTGRHLARKATFAVESPGVTFVVQMDDRPMKLW